MALSVNYKIIQPNDCESIVIEDTTGDYDAADNPGGYGAPNEERADITGTLFTLTELDSDTETVFQKNYLPDPAGAQANILNTDLGVDKIATKCYRMLYEVFAGDTASGAIVDGTRYLVTNAATPGDSIDYDGVTYEEGEAFTGVTGVTTYTESGSVDVSAIVSSADNNFMFWCTLRKCIRDLMLINGSDKSVKGTFPSDFIEQLVNLDMDLNSAIITFDSQMTDCACENILLIQQACVEFTAKCCE